uniref:Uncharacterized protein n=1 Tax=Amphimedon queenslandica TaxID=400682 RepID=A0A1X7VMJ0_AMPQE
MIIFPSLSLRICGRNDIRHLIDNFLHSSPNILSTFPDILSYYLKNVRDTTLLRVSLTTTRKSSIRMIPV